jgi:hypothetical protein
MPLFMYAYSTEIEQLQQKTSENMLRLERNKNKTLIKIKLREEWINRRIERNP